MMQRMSSFDPEESGGSDWINAILKTVWPFANAALKNFGEENLADHQ